MESWNSFETPEDVEAQNAHDAAFATALNAFQDVIGPGITVTLANEYGGSVTYSRTLNGPRTAVSKDSSGNTLGMEILN